MFKSFIRYFFYSNKKKMKEMKKIFKKESNSQNNSIKKSIKINFFSIKQKENSKTKFNHKKLKKKN